MKLKRVWPDLPIGYWFPVYVASPCDIWQRQVKKLTQIRHGSRFLGPELSNHRYISPAKAQSILNQVWTFVEILLAASTRALNNAW
jgi:hypothetical protein